MAIAYNKRTHRCGELRAAGVGEEVILAGWVNSSRDHGGMTFVDIRDHTGITQLRFNPDAAADAHKAARSLHNEDVIAVTGKVVSRGEWVNPKVPTGEIEIEVAEIDVLSQSDPLPFQVTEWADTSEEMRLRYRYLDFRRPEIQRIFRMRHRIAKAVRDGTKERIEVVMLLGLVLGDTVDIV